MKNVMLIPSCLRVVNPINKSVFVEVPMRTMFNFVSYALNLLLIVLTFGGFEEFRDVKNNQRSF